VQASQESLAPETGVACSNKTGVAGVLSLHKNLKGKLSPNAASSTLFPRSEENIVLLDTGHAQAHDAFFPLTCFARFPALEARYEDPLCWRPGKLIRYIGMAP